MIRNNLKVFKFTRKLTTRVFQQTINGNFSVTITNNHYKRFSVKLLETSEIVIKIVSYPIKLIKISFKKYVF